MEMFIWHQVQKDKRSKERTKKEDARAKRLEAEINRSLQKAKAF